MIPVDNWPACIVEQSSFERLTSVLKHWQWFLSENLFSDTLMSVIFFKIHVKSNTNAIGRKQLSPYCRYVQPE